MVMGIILVVRVRAGCKGEQDAVRRENEWGDEDEVGGA